MKTALQRVHYEEPSTIYTLINILEYEFHYFIFFFLHSNLHVYIYSSPSLIRCWAGSNNVNINKSYTVLTAHHLCKFTNHLYRPQRQKKKNQLYIYK